MGMKIAIRMDDITPDMDWEKFHTFETILDEYHICPLIGVVPDNRDANLAKGAPRTDFWDYVKELEQRGWVVAMHGFCHTYTTKRGGLFPLNSFSEFAGVSYEKQKRMLAAGQAVLREQGIETDIFMPPAHSFDRNTLKALRELGFRYITDGFGKRPYERRKLIFLPICERKAKKLSREGVTTFVVHVNSMEEGDFAFYRQLLAKHETTDYRTYFDMPYQKRSMFGNVKEYAAALSKQYAVKLLAKLRSGA